MRAVRAALGRLGAHPKWNQARLLRLYHGWATLFWMAMVPVSVITGWWHSVAYVTVLSLWALVATEFGAYQGSRAETAVQETPQGPDPAQETGK